MFKFPILFLLFVTWKISGLATRNSPAPYLRSKPAKLIENQYLVALYDGHTIDDHFEAIGLNLSQYASLFYRLDSLNAYQARLDSHTVHQLIRHDPGVEFVEPDSYMEDFDAVETGEPFLPEADPIPKSTMGAARRWVKQQLYFNWWWNAMISAGKKLSTPISAYGTYVRSSFQNNEYQLDQFVRMC